MQSATSFFNASLFRGNLRRSWPLWLVYTLAWLLILPLPMIRQMADRHHFGFTDFDAAHYTLSSGVTGGIWMAAVFGLFFAMTMFAYLTNPRATQGFHSMSVRRETLYATNYLTGLFCLAATPAVVFAFTGILTAMFGCSNISILLRALAAALLAVLFFYSFAVFCMMFTGQLLAVPAFYGILNILAVSMEYLVRNFAGNFLYGFSGTSSTQFFDYLSPIWKLISSVSVYQGRFYYEDTSSQVVYRSAENGTLLLDGFGLFGLYAAVGVVFALLGLQVYRKRASEATGSTVAIPWARPLFKYGVALCAAFSLGQLSYYLLIGSSLSQGQYSLAGATSCMVISGLIGYFAAEMLLKKRFQVWRSGRTGALVFSLLLICFSVSLSFDPTGYERYIPDLDDVISVNVTLNSYGINYYEQLTEPETIELAAAAHRALITDKARQLRANGSTDFNPDGSINSSYLYFYISYTLNDGRIISRNYSDGIAYADELNDPGSVAAVMTALTNAPETTRGRLFSELADPSSDYYFTGGRYDVYSDGAYGEQNDSLNAEQATLLFDALEQDYRDGNASRASLFDRSNEYLSVYLELWYNQDLIGQPPIDTRVENTSKAANGCLYITLTPELTHTLAALAEMGVEFPPAAA